MILKRLLGEILTESGFITKDQLEEALERQIKIYKERTLPEKLQRADFVSEARLAHKKDATPMLGTILNYMGYATLNQIEEALEAQKKMAGIYGSLDSEKLGITIETSSIVNSTLNLAEVLSLIMRNVNRVTNSVAGTLMLLDDKTGELLFSVPSGPKAEEMVEIRIPPGKGIAGWVTEHERAVLIPPAKEDPRFCPEVDKISGLETKSILCLPLKAKTKLIGVLEVINKADGSAFTEEDSMLLCIFAYHAGMAIENARLHGDLKDSLEKEIRIQKKPAEFEKFRVLGKMASGVAHDFNNLLIHIQGNTSLMLLGTESDHPHHERLKGIEQSVLKAADVTKQLLGFAMGGKYDVKTTDLKVLVERSTQLFGLQKEEIGIHKEYQEDLWKVDVDSGQISQVLLNLYMNAWQAMPGGGEIYIELQNITLDEELGPDDDLTPGDYVKISISDTGVGMDDATQRRIFDLFFTTKGMARGTGMGLASAYGIIKNHRGIIKVHSEKGAGTTFDIFIPASKKEIPDDKAEPDEILMGHERIPLGNAVDAIIDIEKARPSLDADFFYDRGNSYLKKGRYGQAISDYNKAIGLDPKFAEAYNNRGSAYFPQGQYDQAISDFNMVIELDPKFAKAYNNRGSAYFPQGQYDQAISDFNMAIKLDPKCVKAYNNRGKAYVRGKGQYDQAISDFNMAIELNPEYANAYRNLAWLFATCFDYKYRNGLKAVALAQKAAKLAPTPRNLDTLAAAYAEAGKFEQAMTTQEKAIAQQKKIGDGKKLIGVFMEHLNSYRTHKPWCEKLTTK
ncbi:tetratricopeptide repeat protein [bacterium]|nr:tetratricopeptide repeat protein [bacterium]